MTWSRIALLPTLLLLAASTAQTSRSEDAASTSQGTRPVEEARRTYMGRIVAQPMSHRFSPWLIRPKRDNEESVTEAFDQLGIQSGMTLVDLGCGNGFWTLPMAKACGIQDPPETQSAETKTGSSGLGETAKYQGKVLAVDIQPEMLQKLQRNAFQAKIENVVPILGEVDNPNLPKNEVDLVLMVDVYHEFSHPESMLWEIRNSLKPEGVIALLEFRAEDPNVPIRPKHKMTKAQIMKEYAASNLKLVREYNELPRQHLMFFAREDSPLPAIEPVPGISTVKN